MTRYLVTGAAGFIASRVTSLLLEAGHTVLGVDNLDDAYDVRMKEQRLAQLQQHPKFDFQKLDISQRSIIDTLADSGPYAAVYNLAARAGVRASVVDPWVYIGTNLTGTVNLLELCKITQTPKYIMASTSSIYGENAPVPTSESADSSVPLQPYAASKKGAEAMAHAYHYLNGIDVSILRYFTVYGPTNRPNMAIFRFIKWIVEGQPLQLNGDGSQTRGFTYLDDIAEGTILAEKMLGYEILNLGGHEVISINGLIEMIEEISGKNAIIERRPFPKADMRSNHADTRKAADMLGWKPKVSLREGLERTVDWYMDNREWTSQITTD
ncbi:MAG: NAD-dependent epimerase/dehydratase family protein [Chloroflexota bacterium]